MDKLLTKSQMRFHPLVEGLGEKHEKLILERKNIKFLTYNIFERPIIKNNDSDWKEERLEEFVKILNNFDIICLQEMFGSLNSRKEFLIKHANDSGFFFYSEVVPPSFFSHSLIDGGLVILSRFPIIETVFHPFTYTCLSDHISQKGVQYSKIAIKKSFLHIFNVHLQASYYGTSEAEMNLSIQSRKEHILTLKDIVIEILSEISRNDTVILCGDFNVNSRSCSLREGEKIQQENKNSNYQTEEYNLLIEQLNSHFLVEDIYEKAHKIHPVTYAIDAGENQHKYDTVLMVPEDLKSQQCLDYIFEVFLDKEDRDLRMMNKKIIIEENTIKVEEFLVEDKPFQQLSDHFGISVDLSYNDVNISNYSNTNANGYDKVSNNMAYVSSPPINLVKTNSNIVQVSSPHIKLVKTDNFNNGT